MLSYIDIIFIIISSIFMIIAYSVKQKTLYIIFQIVCNLILIANYIYLSKMTAILTVSVATVRFFVYYLLVKKYNDIHWLMIVLFAVLAAVLGIITANQPIDYLMVAAVVLYTICYKIRNLMYMKMALLVPLSLLLLYAILTVAYSGIICHGFEILLVLIQTTIFIIKTLKKNKNKI